MSNPNETSDWIAQDPGARSVRTRTESTRIIPEQGGEVLLHLTRLAATLNDLGATDANAAAERIIAVFRSGHTDAPAPSESSGDDPAAARRSGAVVRLLAPGGQRRLGTVLLAEVADDDIAEVIDVCERILNGRSVPAREAREAASTRHSFPKADVRDEVALCARRALGVMRVLERTPFVDQNAQALVRILQRHDPDTDLTLTADQQETYESWSAAVRRDLAGHSEAGG